MPTLTLNRQTPSDGFRAAVARWLRTGAQVASRAVSDSPFVESTVRCLEDTADYVDTLDLEDQTQRALYHLSATAGYGTETEWQPGEGASAFRANLGFGPRRPTPQEALSELLSICLDDFIETRGQETRKQAAEIDTLRSGLEELRDADERAIKAEEDRDKFAADLSDLRSQLDRLAEEAGYLRSLTSTAKESKPKAPNRKLRSKTSA